MIKEAESNLKEYKNTLQSLVLINQFVVANLNYLSVSENAISHKPLKKELENCKKTLSYITQDKEKIQDPKLKSALDAAEDFVSEAINEIKSFNAKTMWQKIKEFFLPKNLGKKTYLADELITRIKPKLVTAQENFAYSLENYAKINKLPEETSFAKDTIDVINFGVRRFVGAKRPLDAKKCLDDTKVSIEEINQELKQKFNRNEITKEIKTNTLGFADTQTTTVVTGAMRGVPQVEALIIGVDIADNNLDITDKNNNLNQNLTSNKSKNNAQNNSKHIVSKKELQSAIKEISTPIEYDKNTNERDYQKAPQSTPSAEQNIGRQRG